MIMISAICIVLGCHFASGPEREILKIQNNMFLYILEFTEQVRADPGQLLVKYDELMGADNPWMPNVEYSKIIAECFATAAGDVVQRIKKLHEPHQFGKLKGQQLVGMCNTEGNGVRDFVRFRIGRYPSTSHERRIDARIPYGGAQFLVYGSRSYALDNSLADKMDYTAGVRYNVLLYEYTRYISLITSQTSDQIHSVVKKNPSQLPNTTSFFERLFADNSPEEIALMRKWMAILDKSQ